MSFEKLSLYLDNLPMRGVPGVDMMIFREHELIYRHMAGTSDAEKPVSGDETYWFYSASKLYTMTAMMQLIERGLAGLDDPVSKFIPEFRDITVKDEDGDRPARTVMTVRHLMSMCGGLNYDLEAPVIKRYLKEKGDAATTLDIVKSFSKQPLDFDPGTHFQYSLCHDVAAAVVEVISGKKFGEYLEENIFKPLGIKNLGFKMTEERRNKLAARYHWNEKKEPVEEYRYNNPYVLSENYESGGAGLTGDAESYVLLPDALANGGVGRNGKRILKPESIDTLRENQLHGTPYDDFCLLNRPGYSYALGVRTMIDNTYSHGPNGEFGWDGAAGAWTMIDTENRIAALYMMHVLNCEDAYHVFHPAIRDLIYDGLNEE